LVSVEIEVQKRPTGSAISRLADQRLKNRILSRDKPSSPTQHLSAGKSAAKESTLSTLPRCSSVSGVKNSLRVASANSVYPVKRDRSETIYHAAGNVLPGSASISRAKNCATIADGDPVIGIQKINAVQRRACPRCKRRPSRPGVGALQNRARIAHNETCSRIKENSAVQIASRS